VGVAHGERLSPLDRVTFSNASVTLHLQGKQRTNEGIESREIPGVERPKALTNSISVDGAQLKSQNDGAGLQTVICGGFHLKGSGKSTRSEVGSERHDEDSRESRGTFGLHDDGRSPSGLFSGGADRKLYPVNIPPSQVHSPFSKFASASSLRSSQAVNSSLRVCLPSMSK